MQSLEQQNIWHATNRLTLSLNTALDQESMRSQTASGCPKDESQRAEQGDSTDTGVARNGTTPDGACRPSLQNCVPSVVYSTAQNPASDSNLSKRASSGNLQAHSVVSSESQQQTQSQQHECNGDGTSTKVCASCFLPLFFVWERQFQHNLHHTVDLL